MQKKNFSAPMKVSPKAPQRLPKGPKGPSKSRGVKALQISFSK